MRVLSQRGSEASTLLGHFLLAPLSVSVPHNGRWSSSLEVMGHHSTSFEGPGSCAAAPRLKSHFCCQSFIARPTPDFSRNVRGMGPAGLQQQLLPGFQHLVSLLPRLLIGVLTKTEVLRPFIADNTVAKVYDMIWEYTLFRAGIPKVRGYGSKDRGCVSNSQEPWSTPLIRSRIPQSEDPTQSVHHLPCRSLDHCSNAYS